MSPNWTMAIKNSMMSLVFLCHRWSNLLKWPLHSFLRLIFARAMPGYLLAIFALPLQTNPKLPLLRFDSDSDMQFICRGRTWHKCRQDRCCSWSISGWMRTRLPVGGTNPFLRLPNESWCAGISKTDSQIVEKCKLFWGQ